VELSDGEQAELLAFYMGLVRAGGEAVNEAAFERTYWLCAAQRLMQALGAYGFLGYERGRADFLAHIPVALPRLLAVWARLDGMQELAGLAAEAGRRAGLRIGPDGGTY
jgi:aminoglycoside/choline kinase family phosphotransferase